MADWETMGKEPLAMAKRIAWTAQAKADVRGIQRPAALQILKTLDRYARTA